MSLCHRGVQFIPHVPDRSYILALSAPVANAIVPPDSTSGVLMSRHQTLRSYHCPLCNGFVLDLLTPDPKANPIMQAVMLSLPAQDPMVPTVQRLMPRHTIKQPPPEVTSPELRRDYTEAHAVREISRRGAAALARRALQNALRDKGFKRDTLYLEIEGAAESNDAPSSLREKLHFLRDRGNVGAHPMRDHAGEIADVEEDELDMLFEVLDELFDVFYVRPARHKVVMDKQKASAELKKKKGAP